LQAHVCGEFNVDPLVGIQLIRSATSIFPETAKIAHYVRHNRAFKGSLAVGDDAPDVDVLSIDGNRTTLWAELEKHRRTNDVGVDLPIVILAASFT
jgi:hypothetical protein